MVARQRTIQPSVRLDSTLNPVLVVPSQEDLTGAVTRRSDTVVESLKRFVANLNILEVPLTLHALGPGPVVARQASHVPVVPYVNDDVRLVVEDRSACPVKVPRRFSRSHLRVGDDQMALTH